MHKSPNLFVTFAFFLSKYCRDCSLCVSATGSVLALLLVDFEGLSTSDCSATFFFFFAVLQLVSVVAAFFFAGDAFFVGDDAVRSSSMYDIIFSVFLLFRFRWLSFEGHSAM